MTHESSLDVVIEQVIATRCAIDNRVIIAAIAEQYGYSLVLAKLTRLAEVQTLLLQQERQQRKIAEAKLQALLG
jgi:hypothetical protein